MDMIKLDDLKAYRDDRIASGDSDFDEMDRLSAFIATVETIEPKRGEWINKHEWGNGFLERECSLCGAMKPILMHTAKINYCPNCGARMKGADDE